MPRVNLTEEEAQLIAEHRRKTEVDRTHNAALDLACDVIREKIEAAPFHADLEKAEFINEVEAAILVNRRAIR